MVTDSLPRLGRLSWRDVRRAADLAARAYDDDPLYAYMLPNAARRATGLARMHRTVLGHLSAGERLWSVRDDEGRIIAVALWVTPGAYPLPLRVQVAQLYGALATFRGHGGGLRRSIAYQRRLLEDHPREPHWYLWLIVVDPLHQHRGIGTALMELGLREADRAHVGVYLETQSAPNVDYYRRFGFSLNDTVQPTPEGPPIFTMWRPAG